MNRTKINIETDDLALTTLITEAFHNDEQFEVILPNGNKIQMVVCEVSNSVGHNHFNCVAQLQAIA